MAAWCGNECDGPIDCPVFRLHMTAHWSHLCRDREDYRQLWKEGRGPGQSSGVVTPAAPVVGPPAATPRVKKPAMPSAVARDHREPTGEEKAAWAGEVLGRHSVTDEHRPAVEARLAVCFACPDNALRLDTALGMHCQSFCQGCSGNWGILLAKRLTGELRQPQPCKHWPA